MSLAVWSQERLVLIGGGPGHPKAALQQFCDWSNQENGTILIITWASKIPTEVASDIIDDFSEHFGGNFLVSLTAPQNFSEQYEFLQKLRHATGVFFSGGDQRLIMDTFQIPGGPMVRNALIEAYHNGVVFGGTSAGTAIMSRNMITGSIQEDGNVPVDFGLGFLPPHVIVDQHFSQREREARLLRAHSQSGTRIAIRIDEDTAIIIRNRAQIRVEGDHSVRIFRKSGNINTEKTLRAGDTWTIPYN